MANAKTSAVLSGKQITQSIFFVKHAKWRHRAFPGSAHGIQVTGNHAFVADEEGGLQAVHIDLN
jgi:hypothetical protein